MSISLKYIPTFLLIVTCCFILITALYPAPFNYRTHLPLKPLDTYKFHFTRYSQKPHPYKFNISNKQIYHLSTLTYNFSFKKITTSFNDSWLSKTKVKLYDFTPHEYVFRIQYFFKQQTSIMIPYFQSKTISSGI